VTAGRTSSAGSQPATGGSEPAVASGSAGGAPTLGLSGPDVLYILLALGALALTGVLTRRLARVPG
jgi:hypothetical protein